MYSVSHVGAEVGETVVGSCDGESVGSVVPAVGSSDGESVGSRVESSEQFATEHQVMPWPILVV